jgi:hypothetical protein
MSNTKRNTEAIVQLAKKKSIATREAVERTIARLSVQGKEINFNNVAKEANVAKSWLYNNTDIRTQIETLRSQQNEVGRIVKRKPKNNAKSEESLIKTLKERIKELEKENKELKVQLEKLYGELYSK